MRITVLHKYPHINRYLYYGIILFAVYQGAPCISQTKGENKQGQSHQHVSQTQTPLPTVEAVREEPKTGQAGESTERPIQVTVADNRSRVFEWAGILINFGLLVIVSYQAYANKQQLGFMRQELENNKADSERHERAVKAAEEDVKIAKETFYVGERPYFGILGIGLSIANQIPHLSIGFVNGGRTPAWRVHVIASLVLGERPETGTRVMLDRTSATYAHRFFAAGQEYEISFAPTSFRFTEEQRAAIRDGTLTLFAVGTVHYTDMRGEKLWHDFTARMDGQSFNFTDWEA